MPLKTFISKHSLLLILYLALVTSFVQSQGTAQYTLPQGGNWEKFSHGFVDTFSIEGIRFKILYQKRHYEYYEPGSLLLEKQSKNKWVIIDSFSARGYNYWLQDLNNDGYPDFYTDNRWQYLVYLFDPSQKTFIKCGYFADGDSDTLHVISKDENLYYDKWIFKYNNWWSYLYTIKNNVRYNAGIIEYKYTQGFATNADSPAIKNKYISVRKIAKYGKEIEIKQVRDVDFEQFDIKRFWLKEKSRFYPNSFLEPNYEKGELYSPTQK